MNFVQAITPNPNIPCKPGWCLEYVNNVFDVSVRYGSATAAWNGSTTKHWNFDFPVDVWFPVWFSLAHEPNGHVALMAPDGSVYSTTDPYGFTPRHHPNLDDLIRAYSYNNPLTYLGWTEDVEGTLVITPEDDMATAEENIIAAINFAFQRTKDELPGDTAKAVLSTPNEYRNPVTGLIDPVQTTTLGTVVTNADFQAVATRNVHGQTADEIAASISTVLGTLPDEIARDVLTRLAARVTAGAAQ